MTWRKGDLAVCIDAGRRWLPYEPPLVHGRVYRVAHVDGAWQDEDGNIGLLLEGVANFFVETDDRISRPEDGWAADRFRRIQPASQSFTEQMRALKPKAGVGE